VGDFLAIIKALPIIRDIGKGFSSVGSSIAKWFSRWKARKEISNALKNKDRIDAASNLDDVFRGK
jgi:hypothetical protein